MQYGTVRTKIARHADVLLDIHTNAGKVEQNLNTYSVKNVFAAYP